MKLGVFLHTMGNEMKGEQAEMEREHIRSFGCRAKI